MSELRRGAKRRSGESFKELQIDASIEKAHVATHQESNGVMRNPMLFSQTQGERGGADQGSLAPLSIYIDSRCVAQYSAVSDLAVL